MAIYSQHQPNLTEATQRLDRIMPQYEFDEVIQAILNGKYSWACVLILRSSGYNPLHYIPYRTYKRLLKENSKNAKKTADPCLASPDNQYQHYRDLGSSANQNRRNSIDSEEGMRLLNALSK